MAVQIEAGKPEAPSPLQGKIDELRPGKFMDLGQGLELWLIHISMLKEQDLNARVMRKDAFNQLKSNIEGRGALESLPLCAVTEKGLEVISGHHRTRAAKSAGVDEVWVIVDVTGLNRDNIKAKQLAHNSLQGQDNEDVVRQIFESILDVSAKIEAFIEPNLDDLPDAPKLSSSELEIQLDAKVVTLLFLPTQAQVLSDALERISLLGEVDDIYLATRDEYEKLVEAMAVVSQNYNITSTPTLFAKMSEMVLEVCHDAEAAEKQI